MCGIVGVVTREATHSLLDPDRIIAMRDKMVHRGPDDGGLHTQAHMAFGQRRLSIIDLAGGNQPMPSDDQQLWVLNNGEIYNYQQIRATLEAQGTHFRTDSDTEAILYAYRAYGLGFVKQLRGMFALALWDAPQRRLILARDYAGQKPIYYALNADGIQFASEIKALVADSAIPRDINIQAVNDYLCYGHVPTPDTIYTHIRKLPAGHMLIYDAISGNVKIERYWRWNRIGHPLYQGTYADAVHQLRELLSESVRLHMIADVPLGALLSGGVDSGAVVAMMAAASNQPIKTFTIGFAQKDYDERDGARETATFFHTDHHEKVLEATSVAQIAQKLAYQYDEPFADSSMIPTYYVCELARQFVTVALAGDGGDEIFGGYSRYQRSEQDPQSGGWLRFPLRKRIAQFGKHYYPRRGGRAEELFTRMEGNRVAHYESAMMTFSRTELAALLRPEVYCGPSDAVAHAIGQYDGQNYLAAMQMTDMEHYLPDDILVKVDRVSMLHSLEVRAPLLDQPLMDFAGILPPEWVYKKRIFKDALKGHVPDGMLTRPKSGFAVPLDAWFSDSYHDYLREILLQPNARITAYIAPTTLQKLFSSNRGYIGYQFWSLLMLELWLQYYGQ